MGREFVFTHGKEKNSCKISVGKPKGKSDLERPQALGCQTRRSTDLPCTYPQFYLSAVPYIRCLVQQIGLCSCYWQNVCIVFQRVFFYFIDVFLMMACKGKLSPHCSTALFLPQRLLCVEENCLRVDSLVWPMSFERNPSHCTGV